MKRLLITGASGFLGSRVALHFKEKYDVFTPSHSDMDITDTESVAAIFSKIMPDVVVHCAAISDTGLCEREPELCWSINVTGSVNVVKAAGEIGAKCILCSSDQVYFGSSLEGAHSEAELLTPCNVYGSDKLIAEQECLKINPDCVCLRLSWMYDTKMVNVGEHGNFMRTFMEKMELEEPFYYAIYDIRGISDVNEVICNLEKCFEMPGGVYNFGSSNDRNMYDTMIAVFSNLGLNKTRLGKNEEIFKDNPRNMSMSQRKINEHGITFSTTIENLTRHIEKVFKHIFQEKIKFLFSFLKFVKTHCNGILFVVC